MSRQLEQLLKIDELIRSGKRCTTGILATEVGMGERTIRNDIAFMRDRFDAPISWTAKKGFHYTDPNWRLPFIPLSQGEFFALTLGARMLASYSGSAYRDQLESAIRQLAQRLPEKTWIDLQNIVDDSVMVRSGAEVYLDPTIWQTLEQACKHKRRVWMRYATPGKPVSEREVDPYILHFSRSNPYLTGWCHQRQEVRWFRVDRI